MKVLVPPCCSIADCGVQAARFPAMLEFDMDEVFYADENAFSEVRGLKGPFAYLLGRVITGIAAISS